MIYGSLLGLEPLADKTLIRVRGSEMESEDESRGRVRHIIFWNTETPYE